MSAAPPNAAVKNHPEILAPAGDVASFLAALAAGADAIYLGLKHFSARMQADNFSLSELSRLTDLAHTEQVRVYVAMNTLIKPGETSQIYRLTARLARQVHPDGLIIQDLGMLDLARQAGFEGGLFLSTLANLTHPEALLQAKLLGASRVILPRELSIDEIRIMGEACPDELELECFVHGALCYCISGRCYWSSYMGGKSGLRGRCVQPCRRMYRQGGTTNRHKLDCDSERTEDGQCLFHTKYSAASKSNYKPPVNRVRALGKERTGRWFSCLDLSLDVLSKTLLTIPHLASWKIEGRKKGPHYVYHVVTAYRLLRDAPGDASARKTAEELLKMALGRAPTRARFLPQRSNLIPTSPDGQTSSGLLAGKVRVGEDGSLSFKPFLDLLPHDYLRIGVEDERWHCTFPIKRRVPKGGNFILHISSHKTPKNGTPVFLIDRREPELSLIIKEWRERLETLPARPSQPVDTAPLLPRPVKPLPLPDILLRASLPRGKQTRISRNHIQALWLSPKTAGISRTIVSSICWWLPPVVWPEEEKSLRLHISHLWHNGARYFVCNAPWQRRFFPEQLEHAVLLAGPFCNISNAAALHTLVLMGFTGAFVSQELSREDLLALPKQSPLPVGLVLSGYWPVGISRFGLLGVKANEPFYSPMGEPFWARQYSGNIWIYPAWPLDLRDKRQELQNAGFSFFAHIEEHPPTCVPELHRKSLFNWDGALL